MLATEYKCGDLVMVNGTSPGTERGVIYKVVAVDYKTTIGLPNGKVFKGIFNLQKVGNIEDFAKGLLHVESDVFINEIVPIPLTAEILEKNGYEQGVGIDECSCSYSKDDLYLEYFWDEDKIYFQDFYRSVNYKELQYVHELQHILWALGMDDNLKI